MNPPNENADEPAATSRNYEFTFRNVEFAPRCRESLPHTPPEQEQTRTVECGYDPPVLTPELLVGLVWV
jgi:hypothetical protein